MLEKAADLQLAGRLDESEQLYRAILQASPHHFGALHNLAILCFQRGRCDDTVTLSRAALRLRPDLALIHNTLGVALRTLNRPEEAVAEYDQALAKQPDYAEAHGNRGFALMDLGRAEEAALAFEKAIALLPRKLNYYYCLTQCRHFQAGDAHFAALEALEQEQASLAEPDRVSLHFALANIYADLADYERSFRHLTEGNALKRRSVGYDEQATLGELQRIEAVFTAALMQEKSGLGDPSAVPIFVFGMPRSGTTLVEQILASHPKVFGAGEVRHFDAALRQLDAGPFPEMARSLSPDVLRRLGGHYVGLLSAAAPKAAHVVDKFLENFRYAGLIHLALPKAKMIHLRRDPIDTCFSCYSRLFLGDQPFTYELGELGRYYSAYERLMAHWRTILPPGTILEVQYETLVSDFANEVRRIIAFCGLEWDEACLSFHETKRSVQTASALQVRQPVYRNAVNRWQPYAGFLRPLKEALPARRSAC